MNAKIHVLTSFVVVEQIAKQKLIELFANVLLACKVTLWFLAPRLDVLLAMNVLKMRNVIILHRLQHKKNASHYVGKIHVHLVLLVLQIITEKYVLATTLFKETDMFLVLNVSLSSYCFPIS
jgi:hypothetical protein